MLDASQHPILERLPPTVRIASSCSIMKRCSIVICPRVAPTRSRSIRNTVQSLGAVAPVKAGKNMKFVTAPYDRAVAMLSNGWIEQLTLLLFAFP